MKTRLFALLALVGFTAACGNEAIPVPEELARVWVTSEPRYRGRTFELRPDSLIFGTGANTFQEHAIERVEAGKPRKGWSHYTVFYREDDGAVVPIYLLHRPTSGGSMRFANRKETWQPVQPETGS